MLFCDLLKAVKAVNRKSRYYDTRARTGIKQSESDCTKPRETQGTKNAHENKETTQF